MKGCSRYKLNQVCNAKERDVWIFICIFGIDSLINSEIWKKLLVITRNLLPQLIVFIALVMLFVITVDSLTQLVTRLTRLLVRQTLTEMTDWLSLSEFVRSTSSEDGEVVRSTSITDKPLKENKLTNQKQSLSCRLIQSFAEFKKILIWVVSFLGDKMKSKLKHLLKNQILELFLKLKMYLKI